MSSQNPNPRSRRRIAGERKPARPGAAEERTAPESPSPGAATKPAGPGRTSRPGRPKRREKAAGTEQSGRSGRAARPVPGKILIGLGVLAAVLVAVAAVGVAEGMGVRAYLEVQEEQEVEDARQAAPAAAERAAAAILAYDYETLEADRDAAVRFMTGDYRGKYEKTFGLVLEEAPGLKAVVTAEVKASGVVHADPDRVNVLLFVNQRTVSTANGGEPQLALNRVVFAMEEQEGGWLVDDITSY